ncbi:MAG: hypothetical protein KatS3mg115_2071 [Candidatus Poribacteria bacterium]|nr:MAG: hypothetical protein KatS3mg115_2071 [Candidatus Poribacteria bacterium]
MKRHASLVPLSHNHHHGLVFARRLRLAIENGWEPLPSLRDKFRRVWEAELEPHFQAEETVLAPAMEAADPETAGPLLKRLAEEHATLREQRDRVLREPSPDQLRAELLDFSRRLTAHIRFEERELFEAAQRIVPPEGLEALAEALEKAAPPPQPCPIELPPGASEPTEEPF